ncbi:biotin--[acetyl-CoA-carboxylase] ligase [Pleurocapsa sp. FMAR1]|uniref:biotin--[acetyl-CoA-carboxylase] ligase n=1 Tax=Pleurocapsa sp. FMAR1 TaxID=3040204 RepID=UPI0029C739EA|nr:biotin--[acetyl-CoA-carboxylase] ligase [Pleurocapsa sp. FMAR1]
MAFNPEIHKQVWQKLNQSQIITEIDNISFIPIFVFDSINSTNIKLWELIDRGEKVPVGVIALQQTAGKGQWGKNWVSADGGLYLSIALDLDLDFQDNSHLVMATAWGIATVLRHHELPVTIKWSNDLILNQRKLGGIKIEARNVQNKIAKAVVGVGINWRNSVPDVGISLESYYRNKPQPNIASLEELAAITAYGIVFGYQYYLAVGIEQLLANYLAILDSLGKQVTVNNCPGEVMGVTTDGRLKVKLRSPGATTEINLAPGQISLGY